MAPDRPTADSSDRPSALISPAHIDDLPGIMALLEAQRLPRAEIERWVDTAVVAREDGLVVACAAIEDYGAAGLLRSVAVADARRNTGLGIRITEAALEVARARGMRTIYLLTETAAGFFPRFGFRPVSRDEVAPAVRQSVEFTGACPASAQAMMKDL